MTADLKTRKLFYHAQVKGRERNNSYDESRRENLVVFECVNRLLDKGYKPEDIELEKNWQLGHSLKSGRADICVTSGGEVLFIIECKTIGAEYKRELANMLADGGQLFSYWQQEQSCQWLVLYASDFNGTEVIFSAASVPCSKNLYLDANTVPERFKIWSERYEKKILGDVLFHDETLPYKIGVKPLRKRDLKDFEDKSLVNKFEETLRHNQVSDKENAFNRLVALFICKLVDESRTPDDEEVSFQFRDGSDTHETFQDRLQKLYADGMKKFMGEDIFYLPEDYPDKIFANFQDEENHDNQIRDLKDNFRKLKFYTNNAFAFVEVNNEKLFYLNAKVLLEVVNILHGYRIIGSNDLQTLGDMFEQLLDKGFKQNEGQFFTPMPIAQFIWDSLPLDEIIFRKGHASPPKIIDYACGAGHFLTEGFKAVNDCYSRHNFPPPLMWERDKLFGVEKDYRLARVSKISLFMHGANEGKIKFGDGLEDYPDENIKPASFDILVANPPYSVKGFKLHLKLANENFTVFDKISNDGSEIETLFAERIGQLVKPRGFAAVILPSSILNKDGKSFIAAREAILKNFYIRALVQLGSKTFGATGTNTVIFFLERFDEPPRFTADFEDVAETILSGKILGRTFSRDIFAAYTKKIGLSIEDYNNFLERARLDRKFDKQLKIEREKIIYFGLTYRQTTLIISAPDDVKEQEKFLGYGWSNAKGREGLVHKKIGGFLFDNTNRTAQNTLAALIRAACLGKQLQNPNLDKYFRYTALSDLLDFDSSDFTKKITLGSPNYTPVEYGGSFPLVKLGEHITQIRGVSYKPNDLHLELDNDSILLLRANNINDGKINHDKVQFVSREKVSAEQIIREGDILMCGSSGSSEHVGKVAFCTKSVVGETFGAFCKVIRSNGSMLPEYIAIYLSTPDCRKIIETCAVGSNIKNLKNEHIDNLNIPLPPLAEQKKIVDEFNSLDEKINQAEDTISNLDAAIKTKFAALFEGKNNFIRLDNIADEIIQGTSPKSEFYNDSGKGLPFYQGKKDFGEQFLKLPTMWTTETIKTSIKGDILMSVRAPVGDVNLNPFDEICIGRGLAAIRFNTLATRDYVFHWLYFHSSEISGHKGSTFDSISGNELRAIKLPLPPLELQEEFAMYVRNCEAMKKTARERRAELLEEREGLVGKYFR